MKENEIKFGLVAIAFALLFTACAEETPSPPPEINFLNTDPIVLEVGENSTLINGAILAEAGLATVRVLEVTDAAETQIALYESFSSGPVTTTDNVTYSISFPVTDITENIEVKFEVTDKDDQYVSKSIGILAVNLFESSDTLNAQANGPISAGENKSFLSTADGETYTLNEINGDALKAAKVDIMFMRHTIHKASFPDFSLRSPDEPGISTYFTDIGLDFPSSDNLNSTTLMLVTTELDWDNMDAQEFAAAVEGVESGTDKIDNLDDGDIVAFMTEGSKKGLIHVVKVVDPGSVSERYMKSNLVIDYRVEL